MNKLPPLQPQPPQQSLESNKSGRTFCQVPPGLPQESDSICPTASSLHSETGTQFNPHPEVSLQSCKPHSHIGHHPHVGDLILILCELNGQRVVTVSFSLDTPLFSLGVAQGIPVRWSFPLLTTVSVSVQHVARSSGSTVH